MRRVAAILLAAVLLVAIAALAYLRPGAPANDSVAVVDTPLVADTPAVVAPSGPGTAPTTTGPSSTATAVSTTATPSTSAAATRSPAPSRAPVLGTERTLRDSRITESSGLARSTYDAGLLWTHNDSGDSARLFAVGPDGSTRAVLNVTGASAADWEDLAVGPGGNLWVGDIGDNPRRRPGIQVYRIAEPRSVRGAVSARATRYELRYPDGPHDAEALMVHPRTGRVYVVSKSANGGAVYEAPARLSATSPNRLRRVADAPKTVTSGAFLPDGSGYALVSYDKAYLYRGFGSTPAVAPKPTTRQGESVEVSADGRRLLIGSEGVNSPIIAMALPR